MYVIVIGGGKVGYYLSKHPPDRGYEVTLIEKDPRRAEVLNSVLGEIVMVGDSDEMAFLTTTGMERADVLVEFTGYYEANLVYRQPGQRKLRLPNTVHRDDQPHHPRAPQTPCGPRALLGPVARYVQHACSWKPHGP